MSKADRHAAMEARKMGTKVTDFDWPPDLLAAIDTHADIATTAHQLLSFKNHEPATVIRHLRWWVDVLSDNTNTERKASMPTSNVCATCGQAIDRTR